MYSKFGRVVREIRLAMGLTQEELGAQAGGIGPAMVRDIEAGKQRSAEPLRRKLAQAFGTSEACLHNAIEADNATLANVVLPVDIVLPRDPEQPRFGHGVNTIMNDRRLTMKQLGELAAISSTNLMYILFGSKKPTSSQCAKLAKAFDMSINKLFREVYK